MDVHSHIQYDIIHASCSLTHYYSLAPTKCGGGGDEGEGGEGADMDIDV